MITPEIPSDEDIQRAARFLIDFFPEMPAHRAVVYAALLAASPQWGVELHHEGDKDKKALKKLVKALMLAKEAIEEVSPWIETGLETIMHQCITSISWDHPTEIPVPPHNKKNFHKVVDYWLAAAEEAELMRQSGRPDHGKNWRAIALIDEARKVWTSITGKDAPAKALNEDTRFGRFIAGSLKSVEIYADARNAYEAWADIAHEKGTLLETPK